MNPIQFEYPDRHEIIDGDESLYGQRVTPHQVGQLLGRHGIEAVEDPGRPLDPYRHEAVCGAGHWHEETF
jgi:molecular chaperone GrpE (heat shock protein)